MQTSSYSFLPLLFKEPVYLIKEKELSTTPVEAEKKVEKPVESRKEIKAPIVVESIPETALLKSDLVVLMNGSEGKDFLEKLLQAIKIDSSKVIILTNKPFWEIGKIESPKVISFGVKPSGVKLNHYVPFEFEGKLVLLAEEIGEIVKDVTKKKVLWSALQKMFL